jgi:hypothetical protein
MRALTARELELVNDHLKLAETIAQVTRYRRVPEGERLSAAYTGLCLAAMDYVPGMITFRTFAKHRIRGAVKDTCKFLRRLDREEDEDDAVAVESRESDQFEAVDARDEVHALRESCDERDRRWIDAYLATGEWFAAARMLGLCKHSGSLARMRIQARAQAMRSE